MKKFMYFGIAAIALSMAACSSDDEVAQPEELGVVKTQFTLAIPGNVKTRMSEAVTQAQATPVFRGMDNILLVPFGTPANGDVTKDIIASGDNRLGNNINLGSTEIAKTFVSAYSSTTGAGAGLVTNNNSKLYYNVEVPIGTKSFLFYGKAMDETVADGVNSQQVNGALTFTGMPDTQATPANVSASLVQIYEAPEGGNGVGNALVAYLTAIANAKVTVTVDGTETQKPAWEDAATSMYQGLFKQFTSVRAGSSADVKALVDSLYNQLKDANNPNATAIIDAIKTKATVGTEGLSFDNTLDGYPANIYLPDGAAVIMWDATNKKFVAMTQDFGNNLGMNIAGLDVYTYPASLYYRVNSTIHTDTESKESLYNQENATWESITGQYATANGTVAVNTKSIAISNQIQYAVARLALKVKANTATLQDAENVALNASGSNFQVTGVLIGGQPASVNYLFVPNAAYSKTIYDNQIPEGMNLETSTSDDNLVANNTLVLETASTETTVNFAVEFLNNSGKDFVGKDGIIPNGCKFYLIGQLDITKLTNPTIDQIFKQDYVTEVIAKVGSLRQAYNVIPDLRAPKLELGLSVDLTWQQANTYEVDLGADPVTNP